MTLEIVLFALLSTIIVVSSLGVVFSQNIVRAAVWLLFALIGVSMIYFLLGADFLGAGQLIVYVGGTLVLVIFGVMLTAQSPTTLLRNRPLEWIFAGLIGLGLFSLLVRSSLDFARPPATSEVKLPGVTPLGLNLLGLDPVIDQAPGTRRRPTFLLVFEIISVHLLVVLIAAAYLARAKRRTPTPTETAENIHNGR